MRTQEQAMKRTIALQSFMVVFIRSSIRGRSVHSRRLLTLEFPMPNVTSPQHWDQTEQNAIIDGLVAGGVGGIGMFTADAVAGNEKISELVDMGIPVVTMGGSPATPSKASFCYATDVGASVAYATQAIIDELKAQGKTEGKIVHLCSGLADTNTQKRQAAVARSPCKTRK